MIAVVKPKTPPEILTKKGRAETRRLRKQFKQGQTHFQFRRSIYAAKAVKDELKRCQHSKCAFCESNFKHVGYGDVEHFRPKAGFKQRAVDPLERPGYYWLAYAWTNLFYSCQLCNQQFKKNLFPLRRPGLRAKCHTDDLGLEEPLLVDPSRDDPSHFIRFKAEVVYAGRGRKKGKVTIEVLGLNRDELIEERLRRLDDLRNLHKVCELLEAECQRNPSEQNNADLIRFRTKLIAKQEDVHAYSAMARDFLSDVNFV